MAPNPLQTITQPQAEKLIHLLWVAYNFIGLYGEKHPLTTEAFRNFTRFISETLTDVPSITLHVEHDLIFCEECRIEKKFCGQRLISRLKDSGIQSLSLQSGIQESLLVEFIVALANTKSYPNLAAIENHLQKIQATGLRFNQVAYRKVASDEVVIEQNIARLAQALALGSKEKAGSSDTIDTGSIPLEGTTIRSSSMLDRIRLLSRQMQSAGDTPIPSIDEIAAILSSLRGSIIQGLDMITGDSSFPDTGQKVLEEMDTLTREAILHIIRQEYRQGKVAPDRLAKLILRLIPDVSQLKQLLPLIRKTLLDQGMTNEGYLYIIRELAASIETDSLIELFGKAGENLGLSVNDIIAAIRKNPDAALRLITLAAEITEVHSLDHEQASMIATDVIEHVSRRIALSNKESFEQAGQNQSILEELEMEMVERANAIKMFDPESKNLIEDAIHSGGESSTKQLHAGMQVGREIEGIIGSEKYNALRVPLSGFADETAAVLLGNRSIRAAITGHDIEEETDFWDTGSMAARLRKIVDDEETVFRISTELPKRLHNGMPLKIIAQAPEKTKIILPKTFLHSRQLKENLQHEINRNKRYKSPFSCICISVIPESNMDRGAPLPDEYLSSGFVLLEASVKGLRDLDIIGSLGAPGSNFILLILPHTELKGAEAVKSRIQKKLDEEKSKVVETKEFPGYSRLQFHLSAIAFKEDSCKDIHSVIKQIQDLHKANPA